MRLRRIFAVTSSTDRGTGDTICGKRSRKNDGCRPVAKLAAVHLVFFTSDHGPRTIGAHREILPGCRRGVRRREWSVRSVCAGRAGSNRSPGLRQPSAGDVGTVLPSSSGRSGRGQSSAAGPRPAIVFAISGSWTLIASALHLGQERRLHGAARCRDAGTFEAFGVGLAKAFAVRSENVHDAIVETMASR